MTINVDLNISEGIILAALVWLTARVELIVRKLKIHNNLWKLTHPKEYAEACKNGRD